MRNVRKPSMDSRSSICPGLPYSTINHSRPSRNHEEKGRQDEGKMKGKDDGEGEVIYLTLCNYCSVLLCTDLDRIRSTTTVIQKPPIIGHPVVCQRFFACRHRIAVKPAAKVETHTHP